MTGYQPQWLIDPACEGDIQFLCLCAGSRAGSRALASHAGAAAAGAETDPFDADWLEDDPQQAEQKAAGALPRGSGSRRIPASLAMAGSAKRPRLSGQGTGAAAPPPTAAFQQFACTGGGLPSGAGLTSPLGTAAAGTAGGVGGIGVQESEVRSGQLTTGGNWVGNAAAGASIGSSAAVPGSGSGSKAGRLCTMQPNTSQQAAAGGAAGVAAYGDGGEMGNQGTGNTWGGQQQQQWQAGNQITGIGQRQQDQQPAKRLSSIPFAPPQQQQPWQFTGPHMHGQPGQMVQHQKQQQGQIQQQQQQQAPQPPAAGQADPGPRFVKFGPRG